VNESAWIEQALGEFNVETITPLINLGSATESYRTEVQPHIQNHVIMPLHEREVQVIHADLLAGDGVDVVGSIYDGAVFETLLEQKPNAVLCSNVFEHVSDRELLAERLTSLLPEGGILIVSVPYSFPYHPDPIDTYFRPDLDDLRSLFPAFELLQGDIIDCGTLIGRYRDSVKFMMCHIVGSTIPVPLGRWMRNLHHWLWLTRPYKVSCAVFRKRTNDG
jgi:hypothetical protein